MDKYLSELNDIYNIETKLENKIFKQIENTLYDDSFLDKFSNAFVSVKLDNIAKLRYELVDKNDKNIKIDKINKVNEIDDKLTSKIQKVQSLRKSISDIQFDMFKQEFNIIVKLKDTFDIVINKYDLKIKNKYATIADRLSYDYLTDEKTIINQIPTENSNNDSILYDFISAPIATKYSVENINYMLNLVNNTKRNNSIIIHTFFVPHIQSIYNFYILLAHLFETVDILFPLNLSITNNKVIFVCINKVNDIEVDSNKLYDIKLTDNFEDYYNKLIKFELQIFKFIKSCFELFLYLLIIKNSNKLKYNILKYKIIAKTAVKFQ